MAHHRYAFTAALCALIACAYVPTSAALGAHRAHVKSYRAGARHRAHVRRRWCRTLSSAGLHAKRSSFHSGGAPGHLKRHSYCPRRHSHRRGSGAHGRNHHPLSQAPSKHGPTAAKSSYCPDTDLTPNGQNLERVRAATLCLVNRERVGHGEAPLAPDARLEQAAQAHSEDMAFGDYFEHVGPHGDTPLSRMRGSGYLYSSQIGYEIAENIAWGTLWLATPRAIVSAWMASSGHRENILNARYRDTAIGVSPHPLASAAHGQPGAIYTQDFGIIVAS